MNKLSVREIQLEELEILKKVTSFLDENSIKYTLIGGTLLGAIRHKGFIPWDDDIDIAISRDDYNKLQNIIKQNNHLDNNLYFHSNELGNLNLPFTKVYNYNIRALDERYNDKYEKYLWIDIFPIDGFSRDIKNCYKAIKKQKIYHKILVYKKMTYRYLMSKKNYKLLFKIIFKIIVDVVPYKIIVAKLINLTKYNQYKSSEFAGCYIWGYGINERMPKKDFENMIEVEFENIKFKCIKNYDAYLSNLYGNYMVLPPNNERINHNFVAWRINDEK